MFRTRFCGRGERQFRSPGDSKTVKVRTAACMSSSSPSRSLGWRVRWHRGGLRGCLPAKVGADDHAGQDAQPASHPLPLLGGVRRRRPRRRHGDALRWSLSVSHLRHASPGRRWRGRRIGLTHIPAKLGRSTSSLRPWESDRYPLEGTTRV